MSETAAPAAPAPSETAEPVVQAKEPELPQLTPEQIDKIVQNHKVKVKIEDQEQEVPFDELRRGYQLRQVSDRRMNDAHKEKEKIQTLVQQMKANPRAALKELGIDVLRLSEETLTEHIQSLKMSPQERALMQRDMELAQREQAIKQAEEARKAEEDARFQAQEAQKLDLELTEALGAENFPKSPYAIKRVANVMREYLLRGHQIPARDAVRMVKQDIQAEVQQFIDSLAPGQLEAIAPNGVEALRKSLVAKATGGFPQPTPRAAPAKPAEPKVKKRGSLDQWMKDSIRYDE